MRECRGRRMRWSGLTRRSSKLRRRRAEVRTERLSEMTVRAEPQIERQAAHIGSAFRQRECGFL